MPKSTKEDVINVMASKVDCSKSCAADCLNTAIETITKDLKAGKDVVLTGFGTFMVSKRKARMGRNPQTGASIKIAAKRVPRFKAGKSLKDAVK